MSNVLYANFDASTFNRIFQDLGDVVEQDAMEFTMDETARLAEECAHQLSMRRPKDKGALSKDIRSVFAPMPKNMLPVSHQHGTRGMHWLSASKNSLQGVKEFRFHDTDSVADMQNLFYKSKGHLPANRRTELGIHKTHTWDFKHGKAHGGQHVYELNRVVVRRGVYREFQKKLQNHFGRLEASFADTARKLRSGGAKVRAYVSRHFPSLTNITDLAGLSNKQYPRMEFGSFAVNVTDFEEYIETALAIRVKKMMQRYDLIVSGYSKDVQASISPKRRARMVAALD